MRIIASWFGIICPTEYKYASVIIRQWRAPLGIDTYEHEPIWGAFPLTAEGAPTSCASHKETKMA